MMESNERERRALEAAYHLSIFVNDFSPDTKTFVRKICNDHPTLQQSVMRLFVALAREMANERQEVVDERNERAVELAKKITEIAKDHPLPLI